MLDGMTEVSSTVRSWGPKPAAVIAAGIGGVLLAGLAVLSADASGRLLLGLAAAGLLVTAGAGAMLRPRLAVDPHGVAVRGLRGRRRVPWSELTQWEVVSHHRLGRRVPVLELTLVHFGKELLLLFSRAELGADPVDVLEELQRVRHGGE